MSGRTPDIAFRPVTASDFPMLSAWLAQPHWRQWWGDPETELGYIRDMIAGRDPTRPFVFTVDGRPTGYIQYWFISDHQDEKWLKDSPWLAELPSGTIGVDLSIGDPENLSKGIGTAVLSRFVRELEREGFRLIIIDPDRRNGRAISAYTKAGFRPVLQFEGRTEDVLIMQYQRDAEETLKTRH